ncbi:porin [Vibrio sp. ZSDE26]|uniref:Porin n=1 Tax=Vibrio amylolyticus TaxID=2847292 RepID=A0A9X1XNF5_9VIBR|nr:porin [Vibrio amylolyticus]MCK6262629.1 porin [Vibrio amylolyticus]
MKNVFKKSLVGAAVLMATGAANAYMIGDANDANVEVYGVVSISAVDYNQTGANDGWALENETRVGFRAAKPMTDSVTAFMQVESGWVLDDGAKLGNRDTFVGLRGDDWGQARFGRMLTPLYELVDWPYSASNLGRTFDRGWRSGERYNFDRKSQMGRYDSPMFGDMVKFSLAGGNGSENHEDSNFYGGSISVTPVDMLTLHAAFEIAEGTIFADGSDVTFNPDGSVKAPGTDASIGDTDAYFVGFELRPMDNFNILGAYKTGSYEATSQGSYSYKEREIDAFSVQANYYHGAMNFRVGYADQTGKEDGRKDSDLDSTSISGEVGYSFNTVYTFLRLTQQDDVAFDNDLMVRIGTEWVF